jgi:hypothetical protein
VASSSFRVQVMLAYYWTNPTACRSTDVYIYSGDSGTRS